MFCVISCIDLVYMQCAAGHVYVQLTLLVIYRYVQTSMDTSLYHNDVEFASPGFMLASDEMPKPPPPPLTAKQSEEQSTKKRIALGYDFLTYRAK